MFGTVPKALWSKEQESDELNRIVLATRSLVVEYDDRRLLIDTGCGDKWSEKNRSIFGIDNAPYVPVPDVTDVLLTHLHFDHAGGLTRHSPGSAALELCYPNARHYVSDANYRNAKSPNIRERGSYLPENIDLLEQASLQFVESEAEVWPGLSVHRLDGHTHGLLWVKLTDGETTIAFPADLVPMASHLPIPYVMGYDICAERSMVEKEAFLKQAAEESWIVVFEHDPKAQDGKVAFNDRGRPFLAEIVDL